MIYRVLSFIIIFNSVAIFLSAQNTVPDRKYHKIRYDDDFSFLQNDSLQNDFFDPIKYIALSDKHPIYLSTGGEIRHQYQNYQNPEWEGTEDQDGHLLQRYMFHTDFHLGRNFRLFSQINSGLITGRTPAPRAIIDQNKFEVNQLFLEVKPFAQSNNPKLKKSNFGFRIGKMEETFGTARFIATREGQNVRRSFEGGQLFFNARKWKINALVLNEIVSMPGVFDDFRDKDEVFAGVIASHKNKKGVVFEPYVFTDFDKSYTIFFDTTSQKRISPGFRLSKKGKENFRWNIEMTGQYAKFQNKDIYAWLVAADIGYEFKKASYRPYFGLSFSYATGDKDGKPGGVGTFDPFFPKAAFGQAIVFNPANLTQLHAEVSVLLAKNSRLTLSHDMLFRTSVNDVFYDPCFYPVIPITEQLGKLKHIGDQTKIELKYNFGRHYFMVIEYAIFPPGDFLGEMQRTGVLNYFSTKSIIRF